MRSVFFLFPIFKNMSDNIKENINSISTLELFDELHYCIDKEFTLEQAVWYFYVLYGDFSTIIDIPFPKK